MESEKYLEKKLSVRVKQLGGWSVKLVCVHVTGLPDRLCLMPGGRLFFAEIKTTKKKPKKIQLLIHNKIRKLGFEVYVIDTSEQIENILKQYEQNFKRRGPT